MPDKITCGVDFGTSNSTCAVADAAGVRLVPLERGSPTLPSALFFADTGKILFGREAIKAYIEGEEGRLMRGLKSILGTSLMQDKTLVNGGARSFVDILSLYIAHLKQTAETYADGKIRDVVFGRPVHFHDDNPAADAQSQQILTGIVQAVGFENIVFQFEPIAAAFAHEQNITAEKLSLVIDLGGGTSDFTIIRLSPQHAAARNRDQDILATAGVRVGGTNFDQRLSMKLFMPHLGAQSTYRSTFDAAKILQMPQSAYMDLSDWSKVNLAQSAQAIRNTRQLLARADEPEKLARLLKIQEEKRGHAFLQEVEQTKIRLTADPKTRTDLARVGLDFTVDATEKQFNAAIADGIQRITASIAECLTRASVPASAITLIILTGGSSELPIINQLVQEQFPNAEISRDNKFGSVGLGLAYNAQRIFAGSL